MAWRRATSSVVRVPGAWEIPQALEELAARGGVDGLIAIGAVIRGDTPHFDYICAGCSNGVERVSGKYRIPVAFGVLTCDNTQQAEDRAGGKGGNKGIEAALAALEMASLFERLRSLRRTAVRGSRLESGKAAHGQGDGPPDVVPARAGA